MSTIREQIVQAIVAALNTDRPDGIPETVRTREESPEPDQLPMLTFYQGDDDVAPAHKSEPGTGRRHGAVVKRMLVGKLDALGKAGAVPADAAVDPLLAWGTKAIAGAGRLGGLANERPHEVKTEFSYERSDFNYCRATMTWHIEYQTLPDDAETIE